MQLFEQSLDKLFGDHGSDEDTPSPLTQAVTNLFQQPAMVPGPTSPHATEPAPPEVPPCRHQKHLVETTQASLEHLGDHCLY